MLQGGGSAAVWGAAVRPAWEHAPPMPLASDDLCRWSHGFSDMLGHDGEYLCLFQQLTFCPPLAEGLERPAGPSRRDRLCNGARRGPCRWGRHLSVALVRAEGMGCRCTSSPQVLDVTEQQRHEERLEAGPRRGRARAPLLEAIFETVSVGLLLISSDGRYERMTRRHRETMTCRSRTVTVARAGQLVPFPDGKTLMAKEDMPPPCQGEEFTDYTYWVGDPPRHACGLDVGRQLRGPSGEKPGAARRRPASRRRGRAPGEPTWRRPLGCGVVAHPVGVVVELLTLDCTVGRHVLLGHPCPAVREVHVPELSRLAVVPVREGQAHRLPVSAVHPLVAAVAADQQQSDAHRLEDRLEGLVLALDLCAGRLQPLLVSPLLGHVEDLRDEMNRAAVLAPQQCHGRSPQTSWPSACR